MKALSLIELQNRLGSSIEEVADSNAWQPHSTSFVLPSDAGAQTGLAKAWAMALDRAGGATLVVQATGIWPNNENLYVVETFRRALGETRPLRQAPVHLFPTGDIDNCWSMIALCLHNYWDFVLLSDNRDVLIRVSHDECADVCAHSEAQFQELRKLMQFFKLKEFSVAESG